MKILITGGAGFIGSHLSEKLLKSGYEVSIIDNLSTGSLLNLEKIKSSSKTEIHIDSIFNKKKMKELVQKCDQIYHLAAAVGVRLIVDKPVETIETNILGTDILIKLANQFNKKIFIASTSEVYGKNDSLPFMENCNRIYGSTNIRRWAYAESKAIDEFLALAYHYEKKLPVVIGRLFNTVGPRQSGQYGMVIPRFVQQALLDHSLTVYGDGTQTRCFTHVYDSIEAMVGLMNNDNCIGEVYNIGSDQEISILELAKRVISVTNSNSKIKLISYSDAYEDGFEDMKRRVPDLSKLNNTIEFNPEFNIDNILIQTYDYFKQYNIMEGI
ncbi:MAG: GDP-mannose 4,6-dehydratase [Candidatus Cloacimonetes bacterium]|nr:GDP-mannose 4,6-dehydratase [Candidatus Cloacimonadota bacterium]